MTSSPSLKIEDNELSNMVDTPPTKSKSSKKKRDSSTLRKAPQAPKRFKSSYILFFMAKQQEIKDALGPSATVSFLASDIGMYYHCLITIDFTVLLTSQMCQFHSKSKVY